MIDPGPTWHQPTVLPTPTIALPLVLVAALVGCNETSELLPSADTPKLCWTEQEGFGGNRELWPVDGVLLGVDATGLWVHQGDMHEQRLPESAPPNGGFFEIWAHSPDEGWAIAANDFAWGRELWRLQAGQLSPVDVAAMGLPSNLELWDVWGRSADEVFMVAGDSIGKVYRLSGESWVDVGPAEQQPRLYRIHGDAEHLMVSGLGVVLRYDGEVWQHTEREGMPNLQSVAVSGPDEAWGIGYVDGVSELWRWKDGEWNEVGQRWSAVADVADWGILVPGQGDEMWLVSRSEPVAWYDGENWGSVTVPDALRVPSFFSLGVGAWTGDSLMIDDGTSIWTATKCQP